MRGVRHGHVNVVSQKMFIKPFCKSQVPLKSVNSFFISLILQDKLTNQRGNLLLQNHCINTLCEIKAPGLTQLVRLNRPRHSQNSKNHGRAPGAPHGRAPGAPSLLGRSMVSTNLYQMMLDNDRCDPGVKLFSLSPSTYHAYPSG